ncbi:ATP-dependent RNA helicase [Gryganskiella cystojenkinii]|nr:ATP-dependent RNA helicase [Gryganskiella cystojenkinii]
MSWIVTDSPAPAAAKRSNTKRKKGASSSTGTPDLHTETTESTVVSASSEGNKANKDEETKELSKSQRKRARHQQGHPSNMSEEEKNWAQISLMNVPAMPSSPDLAPFTGKKHKTNANTAATRNANSQKQGTANSAKNSQKNNNKSKKGGKKTDKGEIVVADYNHIDDWGWTPVQTDGILMDDMDGFLCLEELDDVEVAYEGTEETGRTVIFKHDSKAAAKKKGKNTKHSEPLPVDDDEVYYDIDTFDEDVLIQQQESEQQENGEKSGKKAQDTIMSEPEAIEDMGMDVDEKEEEKTETKKQQPVKEQKKKEKKEQPKKEQPKKELTKASEAKSEEKSNDGEEAETETKEPKEKKLSKKEKQALKAAEYKAKREAIKAEKTALKSQEEPKIVYNPMDGVDADFDISAWKEYKFSPMIENGLKKAKFTKPSPIQEQALPLGLAGRDVVGVAETGSGKTLAFGLPIVECLARQAIMAAESHSPLSESLTALILTPTRELAIQVKDHLVAFTQFTGHHVVPIVGGMSIQKQTRQMDRNPAIVVATPGRLWELISTNPTYSERLVHTRFLVLDEADRMLESGHFQELSNILKLLERKREKTSDWEQHVKDAATKEIGDGIVDAEEMKKKHQATLAVASIARTDYEWNRQTFIFTATLSKELSLNLSKKRNRAKANDDQNAEGTMEDLMARLEFHDETPAFVKILSDKIVAATLLEGKIDCLTTEKDLYLYYFAMKYPGRTLVFVNSIDAIRHLVPMMQLLGIDALGMHAQMQQRQRLKNLDRFKSNPRAFMIASDVAARGLDIPLVDHVIHYQVPRSGDIYVHRSGRTARAQNEGISLLICGPEEVPLYKKICVTLKKDKGIPEFPVDRGVINEMKKRVALAKKIDEQEHRVQKSAHQDDWMLKSAEAMDIILDEDILNSAGKSKDKHDDDTSAMTGRKNKIKGMRAELKAMLQKRMMPQGASAKYITSGVMRDLADRLRDSANHNPMMPAHLKSTALEDIKSHKEKQKSSNKKAAAAKMAATISAGGSAAAAAAEDSDDDDSE